MNLKIFFIISITVLFASLVAYYQFFDFEKRPDTSARTIEIKEDKNGNFFLYVANHSPTDESIDITVYFDDKVAVKKNFKLGDIMPNWKGFQFLLTPGLHKIKAVSEKGKVQFEQEFAIGTNQGWAALDYRYDHRATSGPDKLRNFGFSVLDHAPMFQ